MAGNGKDLRTPLARAHNHGSAGGGTEHWWQQRASALLLAGLTVWLFWALFQLVGASYSEARAFIASPLQAGLLILLAISLFHHAKLGVQVVIEDYVHTPWLEFTLQLLVKLGALLGMLAAAGAILKIAIGG